jgi:hypothetical protein
MSLDCQPRSASPPGGAVSASFGLVSSFADLQRSMEFAAELIDLAPTPEDLPNRTAC